jgi:cytochrome P450
MSVTDSDAKARVNFMGENVVASEGAQWRRFRKILQRPFNEAVMSTVWQATLDQLRPLRNKWCDAEAGVDMKADITKMALGVICGAGFGVEVPFQSEGNELPQGDEFFASSTPPRGYHFNFGSAINHLLSNIVTVLATKLLFPGWLLIHGPVPKEWRDGAISLKETRNYIRRLVLREKERNEAGYYEQGAGPEKRHHYNLLTTLTNPELSGGLTEDEQIANTFIMALAGHETSAGVMGYSIILLALFQDKQDWLLNELDKALEGIELEDWTYKKLFPRLLPCLCIMVVAPSLH